jgi:hypothetical protein
VEGGLPETCSHRHALAHTSTLTCTCYMWLTSTVATLPQASSSTRPWCTASLSLSRKTERCAV